MRQMPDSVFFHTNILVYTVARNDPRHEKALALLGAGGVVSVQVLNEFVSVVRRKVQVPWTEVAATTNWFQVLCPDAMTVLRGTHEEGLRIAERYAYQIYDSLMI